MQANYPQLMHLQSRKPFLKTMRDGLIVAIITVIVMIMVYYIIIDPSIEYNSPEFYAVISRSFIASLLAQFAYEYSGFNSHVAESSIRYAPDSLLARYQTRYSAHVATTAANEILANPNDENLRKNYEKILLIIKYTQQIPKIYSYARQSMSPEQIHKYLPKVAIEDIDALMHLVNETNDISNIILLKYINKIIETLGRNESATKYVLGHGFEKFMPDEQGVIDVAQIIQAM